MFIVHSTLRDATTPYTKRCVSDLMKKHLFVNNYVKIITARTELKGKL